MGSLRLTHTGLLSNLVFHPLPHALFFLALFPVSEYPFLSSLWILGDLLVHCNSPLPSFIVNSFPLAITLFKMSLPTNFQICYFILFYFTPTLKKKHFPLHTQMSTQMWNKSPPTRLPSYFTGCGFLIPWHENIYYHSSWRRVNI